MTLAQETIILERTYKATPARVFEAWRDPVARERWSKPSDDTGLVYEQADFRVGGEDISRCGPKDDMRFLARVRYLEIVPDARIVVAESIAENGKMSAASLIVIDFEAVGQSTRMTVTMHVSGLDGPEFVEGYREGWNPTLDNLAKEF